MECGGGFGGLAITEATRTEEHDSCYSAAPDTDG